MLMKKFFCELGYEVGDKVKCVQSDPAFAYTVGQIYELIPYEEKDRSWPAVYIDDMYLNGVGASWLKVHDWSKRD